MRFRFVCNEIDSACCLVSFSISNYNVDSIMTEDEAGTRKRGREEERERGRKRKSGEKRERGRLIVII